MAINSRIVGNSETESELVANFRVARDPGNMIQAQSVQASSASYKRLVDRPEYRSGSLLSSVSIRLVQKLPVRSLTRFA